MATSSVPISKDVWTKVLDVEGSVCNTSSYKMYVSSSVTTPTTQKGHTLLPDEWVSFSPTGGESLYIKSSAISEVSVDK